MSTLALCAFADLSQPAAGTTTTASSSPARSSPWPGSWMQNTALAWLVLELSGSPLAVGALVFCRFLPFTVLGLVAGFVVDRLDTRRVVMATQASAMAVSVLLAVVTLAGNVSLAARLRPGGARWRDPRVRRTRPAGAHVRAGRARGAAERRRAQLWPLQRLAHRRPRRRGRRDRRRRHRLVLRRQRGQLPGSPRSARAAAQGRAGPVERDGRDRHGRRRPRSARHVARDRELRAVLGVVAVVSLVGFNFHVLVPLLAAELDLGSAEFGLLSAAFGAGALAGALVVASMRGGEPPHVRRRARPASACCCSRWRWWGSSPVARLRSWQCCSPRSACASRC